MVGPMSYPVLLITNHILIEITSQTSSLMEGKSSLSSAACPGRREQVPITHGHTATASEDGDKLWLMPEQVPRKQSRSQENNVSFQRP